MYFVFLLPVYATSDGAVIIAASFVSNSLNILTSCKVRSDSLRTPLFLKVLNISAKYTAPFSLRTDVLLLWKESSHCSPSAEEKYTLPSPSSTKVLRYPADRLTAKPLMPSTLNFSQASSNSDNVSGILMPYCSNSVWLT